MRVLVVEDEPVVRAVLRRILKEAGHDVVEADSEWSALESCLGRRIDLVILDVDLKGKDGIGAMAGIRQLQPDVPIIVVSGGDRGDILDRIESKRLGSRIWWLGQPFVREELLGMAVRALAG